MNKENLYPNELSQRELFQAAAVKCAEMEENLCTLIEDSDNFVNKEEGFMLENGPFGLQILRSYSENIIGIKTQYTKRNAPIIFYYSKHGPSHLEIAGLNTDKKIRREFDKYATEHPEAATARTATFYEFSLNGDYKKSVRIPEEFEYELEDPKIIYGDQYEKITSDQASDGTFEYGTIGGFIIYESEMTAEDFEIAGQALQMLTNRLQPPEEPSSP